MSPRKKTDILILLLLFDFHIFYISAYKLIHYSTSKNKECLFRQIFLQFRAIQYIMEKNNPARSQKE